ncbi:MAG: ATPase, T2SS/T4P/T4SS family, partial [Thermodesulfobacteriota bacterium]|nr:ATPase, T2SS/T4P/T4SS family [Thermodesulfobacteriota bacterium]
MYESFYGLKEKPFNITPDPDYFYMSQVHENAYTHLQYAIKENKGFVVITGEIGSGKTTLINLLLKNIEEDVLVGVISSATLLPEEFIKMACQELELGTEGMDKVEMVDALHQFLLKQFAEKKRVVLIIDEAQNLPLETIEEIRVLSNLDTEKDHLIQMILVGQPELKSKLQQRQLKQFVQRV